MADLGTVRTSVATALATITGLRVHSGGLWPDSVNSPVALLKPQSDAPMSLDETTVIERFELVVVVKGGGQYESAQKALDPYCSNTGSKSVKAALQTGLGGLLLSANRRDYGVFEVSGMEMAGAAWNLEVISS